MQSCGRSGGTVNFELAVNDFRLGEDAAKALLDLMEVFEQSFILWKILKKVELVIIQVIILLGFLNVVGDKNSSFAWAKEILFIVRIDIICLM